MAPPREDLDTLLANTRWVRALGVELVGAGEADDVVQDAWVVALEGTGVLNPPAWFSGVLRRLARRKASSATLAWSEAHSSARATRADVLTCPYCGGKRKLITLLRARRTRARRGPRDRGNRIPPGGYDPCAALPRGAEVS
jgi:hypothetical protein